MYLLNGLQNWINKKMKFSLDPESREKQIEKVD